MAKTNSKSKRSQIADLALQIADHQARIQTLAANWGEEINAQLNATEKAFLTKLAKELKNFKFNSNAKETLDRLKKITARLNAIRKAAYERAEEKVREEARKLAENEMKWGKRITQELSEPGTRLKDPSPTLLDKVVKFGLADGKTLQEYFSGIADADAVRIESSIRQGVESGWTIDQIARNITGTAENHYKDGVFETSRKSAVNMARTLCNAVSNNAKDAFYNANSDVISGVEILSTLDGRTCPVCASLDRQRYPLGKPHPALPVHHSCRCVLLPVTPLSDLIEEERPMANSDFMKDAKEAYKKRFPKKDWDSLSDSTKKKYYYEAMRLYEKRTGKPAYTQVSGSVSFRDYFEKHMTDDQRLKWLGPERFKIWKHGNLPLDKFIPPYPDKRLTVDALKELDKKSFEKEKTPAEAAAAKAKAEAARIAKEAEKPAFVPAKTTKEAEEYISQFVNKNGFGALGVSYTGVNIDVANEINKQLGFLCNEFDVKKFGGIIAPAGNTKLGKLISDATAAYSPIRNSFMLNRESMKSLKVAEQAFAKEKEVFESFIHHPERYDLTKLSKRTLDILNRAKISGRATVPQTIAEAITHEFGHMIERDVMKHNLWRDVEARMSEFADKISGYAGMNTNEYIAESFISYMKGESVADPDLISIFESLKRR